MKAGPKVYTGVHRGTHGYRGVQMIFFTGEKILFSGEIFLFTGEIIFSPEK